MVATVGALPTVGPCPEAKPAPSDSNNTEASHTRTVAPASPPAALSGSFAPDQPPIGGTPPRAGCGVFMRIRPARIWGETPVALLARGGGSAVVSVVC